MVSRLEYTRQSTWNVERKTQETRINRVSLSALKIVGFLPNCFVFHHRRRPQRHLRMLRVDLTSRFAHTHVKLVCLFSPLRRTTWECGDGVMPLNFFSLIELNILYERNRSWWMNKCRNETRINGFYFWRAKRMAIVVTGRDRLFVDRDSQIANRIRGQLLHPI